MKIAVWYNLPSGGAKRALFDQIKGLLDKGHTLEAWCPPTADQNFLPLADLIKEHIVPLKDPTLIRRSLRDKLNRAPYGMDNRYLAMVEHCKECASQIHRDDFDLLFAGTCVQYRVSPIARFVDLPSVLYLQEPFRWLYEALPELPWLAPEIQGGLSKPSINQKRQLIQDLLHNRRIRIQARQELISVKAFNKVLANSLYSRESMLRAYGIDASVCYLGINTELFVSMHQARENMVLGVGSFDRIKNIDFVIRAVAQLKELNPSLVWVGNSGEVAYQEELSVLAANLGVDYRPKLMVSDAELVAYLNTARVMAYAPRLEPFGLTPLEANFCELPVVGVAEAGVRETICNNQNGLLVQSEPSAMASALKPFLTNPEYAMEFGRRARVWATENWSLKLSIDRLDDHLHRAYESNRK